MTKQITPKVRVLYADGDTIITLWDGTAVAKDGKPYNNTYSWYMTIKNNCIVKAIAFFDTLELADIWQRIPFDATLLPICLLVAVVVSIAKT
jgi:ketosteroid isomerase-like protein